MVYDVDEDLAYSLIDRHAMPDDSYVYNKESPLCGKLNHGGSRGLFKLVEGRDLGQPVFSVELRNTPFLFSDAFLFGVIRGYGFYTGGPVVTGGAISVSQGFLKELRRLTTEFFTEVHIPSLSQLIGISPGYSHSLESSLLVSIHLMDKKGNPYFYVFRDCPLTQAEDGRATLDIPIDELQVVVSKINSLIINKGETKK